MFFRGFDAVFRKTENGYAAVVKTFLRRTAIMMLLFLGLLSLTGWQFTRLPTGFLPIEDQGYVMASIQLPDAASLQRSDVVARQVEKIIAEIAATRLTERGATRADDRTSEAAMEDRKKEGYF